jgi:hypothetical protein
MMHRYLLAISLLVGTSIGCSAQRGGTVYEPVRFEDGTPVDAAAEGVEDLFAQDRFLTDTTLTEKGDTLFTVRHSGAFVRLQLDGVPSGIDKISLVPMEGAPTEIPVSNPGTVVVWMAKEAGGVGATAAVAQAPDGRLWSTRLPALTLQPGVACRWTGTCLPPDAPAIDLEATPLPATLLDIEPGEYSGITHISGNRYAVVDDKLKGGGIVFLSIPLDAYGNVGTVRMQVADGTAQAGGKARDCEGIAFVPSAGALYVSAENQEIRGYDLAGRENGKALRIPKDLGINNIQSNRGFEALTYNDATGLFWTTTESPLKKDTFLPRLLRLQSFNAEGEPGERYFYQTGEPLKASAGAQAYVHGVPALAALDDGRLLVLEREVYVPKGGFWDKLSNSFTKIDLYLVDPVRDPAGFLRKSPVCSFRTSALDLANFEGMCLGPALPDGTRPLLLIADSQKGSGGLTQEYVKVILLQLR